MNQVNIGVDIGGSHISVAGVNKHQLITGTQLDSPVNSNASARSIFNDWATAINNCHDRLRIQGFSATGIGIAMPGAFNYKKGIALFKETAKFNNLYGMAVKQYLQPLLTVPDVDIRFINDATAFAIGTAITDSYTDQGLSLAIVLGTGFGTALTQNAHPVFTGKNVPEAGCFWHLPYKEGIADDYFSTRWMVNRYRELSSEKVGGVHEIARKYATNHDAQVVFDEFGSHLADFLSPYLSELNIGSIILGGKISLSADYFLPSFLRTLGSLGNSIQIQRSEILEQATIIGAAHLANDDFWSVIKEHLPEK